MLVRHVLYITLDWMSSEIVSNQGLTAEIAESAEGARGIEIRLRRGCLAGEGGGRGFQISDLRFQIELLVMWDPDKWCRDRCRIAYLAEKRRL